MTSIHPATDAQLIADLAEEIQANSAHLPDLAAFADSWKERDRYARYLRINLRTMAKIARYVADPPSFYWHLHREPHDLGHGVTFVVYSIHT